jgi:hypothetical protein
VNISIFCDIAPCSPLKVNSCISGTCRRALHATCFLFLVLFIILPWRRRHVPPKLQLTSDRPHGVTSQKIELFITTAVRTWSPITSCCALKCSQCILEDCYYGFNWEDVTKGLSLEPLLHLELLLNELFNYEELVWYTHFRYQYQSKILTFKEI